MATKRTIRSLILHIAKLLGAFSISQWVTRGDLRILCYHGAALEDEHAFRPKLFITERKFEKRLNYLAESKYRVTALDEALKQRQENRLPPYATVITIDDGWFGTYSEMAPLLRSHLFPATLYVSTYYMEKQTQVFNVAVDYAIWRAGSRTLNLGDVDAALSGKFDLSVSAERANAATAIVRHGESGNAGNRQLLFIALCEALDLDGEKMVAKRLVSFMSAAEAAELSKSGIDLQLHTHRHRFPNEHDLANQEIEENRAALTDLATGELAHFCYPSGEYSKEQIPWLEAWGIASATTTETGINRKRQSPYELLRILDSEDMSDIEFEAELCGFTDLIRRPFRTARANHQ